MKRFFLFTACAAALALSALLPGAAALAQENQVLVRPTVEVGPIRPLNGGNNAPTVHNLNWFKAAHISYVRTHDAMLDPSSYGRYVYDIRSIFRDFSADVDDPASYDFFNSDKVLKRARDAGEKILYRLGQTIEPAQNKYYIYPPEDYLKWAKICEHIIRHYNEGWANGYHWNIEYWEIWNEPDLDRNGRWKTDPRCWGGPDEEFDKFYAVVSKHLKKKFPKLKIGGPGFSNPKNGEWLHRFLKATADAKAPMDFFSWHIYTYTPEIVKERSDTVDAVLAKYGFKDTESILDEWNYVWHWAETTEENAKTRHTIKGAAFLAATMTACQNETPIQVMTCYDFRPNSRFNQIFDATDRRPLIGYYPFYAWGQLLECGTQVKTEEDTPGLYAVAAKSDTGRLRILVSRYTQDNNEVYGKKITIKVEGVIPEEVRVYLADSRFFYSDYPVPIGKDGTITLMMEPCSFAMIEL